MLITIVIIHQPQYHANGYLREGKTLQSALTHSKWRWASPTNYKHTTIPQHIVTKYLVGWRLVWAQLYPSLSAGVNQNIITKVNHKTAQTTFVLINAMQAPQREDKQSVQMNNGIIRCGINTIAFVVSSWVIIEHFQWYFDHYKKKYFSIWTEIKPLYAKSYLSLLLSPFQLINLPYYRQPQHISIQEKY